MIDRIIIFDAKTNVFAILNLKLLRKNKHSKSGHSVQTQTTVGPTLKSSFVALIIITMDKSRLM